MSNAVTKSQTPLYSVPGRDPRHTPEKYDGLQRIPDEFYVGNTTAEYGRVCVEVDEYDRTQEVSNWRGIAINFIKERLKDSPRVQAPVLRPKCLHVYTGVYVRDADCNIECPRISGCIKGIENHGGNLKIDGAAGHLYGGDIGCDMHEYATIVGLDSSDFRIGFNLLAHGNNLTACRSQNSFEHGFYIDGQSTLAGCKVETCKPHDTWLNPVGITFTKRANFSSDIGGMMSVPRGSVGLDVVGAHCLNVQRMITCTGGGVALRLRDGASDGYYFLTICGEGAPARIDVSGAGTGNTITVTSGTTSVEVIGKCHESNKILGNVRRAA